MRARIVLRCAEGGTIGQAAVDLGVSRDLVSKWRSRFLVRRLEGLTDEPCPGRPRFHLCTSPRPASSWLNLVVRWFAELTNCKLRRSAHGSVVELETDVRKWINEWNTDPKPFVWTKTANQILDTLATYCSRINDSRH